MNLFMALLLAGPDVVPSVVAGLASDDYPAWARRGGIGGRVRVELGVAPDGSVTTCRVIGSTGHFGLDKNTCDLFVRKVRYVVSNGVELRVFATSISWRIPEMRPLNALATFSLNDIRGLASWKLDAPASGPPVARCVPSGRFNICDVPPVLSLYRPDSLGGGKATAVLRADDTRLVGIRIELPKTRREEAVAAIRAEWGPACFRDDKADITGWIAGNGYVVIEPDAVAIGAKDMDAVTEAAAKACPPLSE